MSHLVIFRTVFGLRLRSVGEHPKAAETVGIDVIRLRYRNVILGGIFAGLAGAWFTLDFGNSFQAGMTAGRGFIALAALIFGRWMPLGAFGAALLFASASSLSIALRTIPPTGQLGDILTALPNQFWAALPYLVTIIILAGAVGRSGRSGRGRGGFAAAQQNEAGSDGSGQQACHGFFHCISPDVIKKQHV